MNSQLWTLAIVTVVYLIALAVIGYFAYLKTKTAADYLVAGRKAHPVIMALSYGATFISTSAIVGFGGAAANFGMGLLWLTFFNIFVGIFVAFVVFGKRTRKMGHNLNSHTFPELLGHRYQSKFIQFFVALVIFVFMPVYASAVLLAAAKVIVQIFQMEKAMTAQTATYMAILIYTVVVSLYVIMGGLKGVMWTDALQGGIMLLGMIVLIAFAYKNYGGVTSAHEQLSGLQAKVETNAKQSLANYNQANGTQLTMKEVLGTGKQASDLNTKLGKMTPEAKDAYLQANPKDAELLKAWTAIRSTKPGGLASMVPVAGMGAGGWQGWTKMPTAMQGAAKAKFWCFIVTTLVLGVGIGVLAQPQLSVRFMTVKSGRELNRAVATGGFFILMMTGVAFVVGALSNVHFFDKIGEIAIVAAKGDSDQIIPLYINQALPHWFVAIFTLTLLSAAMSTQSSQFHTIGTALGRDIFEQTILGGTQSRATVLITRLGITIGIILTLILAFKLPTSIVPAATALFFGLCASAFLPMYFCGLFWRGVTRAGAICGMCVGFLVSMFWLFFVQVVNAKFAALLLPFLYPNDPTQMSILPEPWRYLDALVIAFPLAVVVTVAVSLVTKKLPQDHVEKCFSGVGNGNGRHTAVSGEPRMAQ